MAEARGAAPTLLFSYKESSGGTPGIQELVRPRTRLEAIQEMSRKLSPLKTILEVEQLT